MTEPNFTVAIVGAGRLGKAVARTMHARAHRLVVWARRQEQARAMVADLDGATAVKSLPAAVADADVTVLAVPVSALRRVARQLGTVVQGDHVILHATRGVEAGFVLPHTILREETCVRRIGVLGGPIYAPQLAGNKVIAAVLGTRFIEPWEVACALTEGSPLRLHRTPDVVGVQVAGAVSHAAALVVGVAQGLGLGDTARGLFLTRGLTEAATLTSLCGGDATTLIGLAGVGDLIPRYVATASRHSEAGRLRAAGEQPDAAALLHLDGVITAQAAVELAHRHDVELPLMQAAHDIFAGRVDPRAACDALLALDFNPKDALLRREPAATA